jgi:anti-anti-sigma factor
MQEGTMDYQIQDHGKIREIAMSGDFTFADNPALTGLLGALDGAGCDEYVLALGDLESIDSAGLGMLILLNDAAQEKGARISIRDPKGQVKTLLEVTEFGDVIPIDA